MSNDPASIHYQQCQLPMSSMPPIPPTHDLMLANNLPLDVELGGTYELLDDPDRGMGEEIKHLYRKDNKNSWEEWAPDVEKLELDRSKNSKFPVIVRRERDTNAESGLSLHSITIQSPLLCQLLDEVFDGCRTVNTKMKTITLNKPFHELFFRWDRYEACVAIAEDEVLLAHVTLLDSIIKPEIKPIVDHKRELLQQNVITFEYLWTLFEPETEVYAPIDGQDRILQVQNTSNQLFTGGINHAVSCRYIDYDGYSLGFRATQVVIDRFKGQCDILDLAVIPLCLHPERESIIERTSARGRKFEELRGVHYKAFSGYAVPADRKRKARELDHGRVMIDAKLHGSHHPDMTILTPLDASVDTTPSADPFGNLGMPMSMPMNVPMVPPAPPLPIANTGAIKEKGSQLEEYQYRLCTSQVKGYCLTSKQWVRLQIDGVSDIKWNQASFKHLYLPADHKDLILAFVESHLNQGDKFDDIVEGKGKGMVMLLSGVPGVGKTLTAEAVAEQMKKPLYSMSAGQLGPDVESVEDTLKDVLEICTAWGAVLLMDEADVFLEKRQMTDIARNKLVSVFLRLIEYYDGCMFLTTNRVNAFDAAFKSRIDLHIDYPDLDTAAKRHIWKTFVMPSEHFPQNTSCITHVQLDVLAQLNINGREIKNMVKTGRLLANRKGEELSMKHLKSVMSVQKSVSIIEETGRGFSTLELF